MKMKKLGLSILTLLFSVIMLSSCSLFNKPTPPDGGDKPVDPPKVTEPVKKSFTDYFTSSVVGTYLYTKTEHADQNGNVLSFEALVNQQIDILTQDIIYRLISLYGNGVPNAGNNVGSYNEKALHLIDPLTNTVFKKGSNNAIVSSYSLINSPSSISSNNPTYRNKENSIITSGNNLWTDDAASFAYSLKDGNWEDNVFTNNFNLVHAINGGFTYSNGFTNSLNTTRKWTLSNSNGLLNSSEFLNTEVIYEDFYANHFDTIKLAIANLLSNGKTSGYSYSTAISEINHLGYTEKDKTLIINYVLNNVIGSGNVSYDNSIKPQATRVTSSTNFSSSEHLYKGYSLLVPKILEQAFNNTFANTSNSLWLSASKEDSKEEVFNYNAVRNENYVSMKITPKTSIPLTKLILNFSGTYSIHLKATYSIYSSSSSSIVLDRSATVSSSSITLDFSSYKSNTISSNGYILIKFNHSVNGPFSITFDGYYDKV